MTYAPPRDDDWDPFTPFTDEQKAVAAAGLGQLGATLGVSQHPLELYPNTEPGDCDDCKQPHDSRRQYVNVQLCDPCIRLRERTRLRLQQHQERPAEPTQPDTETT